MANGTILLDESRYFASPEMHPGQSGLKQSSSMTTPCSCKHSSAAKDKSRNVVSNVCDPSMEKIRTGPSSSSLKSASLVNFVESFEMTLIKVNLSYNL